MPSFVDAILFQNFNADIHFLDVKNIYRKYKQVSRKSVFLGLSNISEIATGLFSYLISADKTLVLTAVSLLP